ncbi:MAG: PKD domain-containing protein [Verrucomicrobiales bacterium]|nr:PKD domain-containing protein [Verrucomicrobiales bacterium]
MKRTAAFTLRLVVLFLGLCHATTVKSASTTGLAGFQQWRARPRLQAAEPGPEDLDEGLRWAKQRRSELAELIASNPRRALQWAIPDRDRAQLPAAVQPLLEQRIEGRGDLEVLCALPDPADDAPSPSLQRFAVINGQRYRAYVTHPRLGLVSRRNIQLRGFALDDAIVLADDETEPSDVAETALLSAAPAAPAGQTPWRRLILIRVDFSDLAGESFSSNRAVQLVRELHQFYQNNSFGRAGFAAIGEGSAVTEVFRLPRTASSYGGANDANGMRTDARAAARAAGYDLTTFDNDVICLASVPGFKWAGLGFVGGVGAWIRGTSSTGVTAHELGHNLGLLHANFWDTGGQTILGAGSSIEYGDKFDTMGAANAAHYHFNARYKRLLGWLQPGEFSVATTNGTYRIHAHDQTNTTAGSRGLQIFANARTNYWVEFRRQFTGNPWLMNGVGLRWTGRANEASLLLDTTPGSSGEKDDATVLLGRTFSDPVAGIHVTPLRLGQGPPDWIEVDVHRGSFPLNHAPVASLDAPILEGTTAQTFRFSVAASDPDGDELAYFWEFGDNVPGENSSAVNHRWSSSGDFRVRCTVSDLRGGRSLHSVAVRVGSPTTLRLSGRVFADGAPASGVRVSVGQGRVDMSDDNGAFTITGLSTGTYTVTALAEDGSRFEPISFTNPLNLTSSIGDLVLVRSDDVTSGLTTLVAAGATWHYWDQGTAPVGDWKALAFDDSAWNEGAAILGYGGDRETTVISFGSQSNQKFITAWFRQMFKVDDPALINDLKLALLRDDGAVIYLNGHEIVRDNMPNGTITATTLASSTVGGTAETTYFEHALDPAQLVAGTNVIAAEIHQSSRTSSDTAFDLRLTAEVLETGSDELRLVRPSPDAVFTTPDTVILSAAIGEQAGANVTRVAFRADDVELGQLTQPPFVLVWNNAAPGTHVLQATAEFTDGTSQSSAKVPIKILDAALTPLLIPRGSSWRFLESTEAPPNSWTQNTFDDSGWPEGPARLGYGEDGEFTLLPLGSGATPKPITTWFRHAFEVRDTPSITNLVFRLQRDDGAIVYLNGAEQFRLGLRAGDVTPTTTAQADLQNDAEQTFVERSSPPDALVEGLNCVAVELHQFSASNADLGFDLELGAQLGRRPVLPRLQWQITGQLLEVSWPDRFADWRLETAASLAPPVSWQTVPGTPRTVGDRIAQTLPIENLQSYFRIRQISGQ